MSRAIICPNQPQPEKPPAMIPTTRAGKIHRTRTRLNRVHAFFRWPRILVAVLGAAGCAQHRIIDGPPLQIHRQLTGEKFTYNSPAEQPVWDWFSLDPAFASTLERHPTALEQARRAGPPHTANQVLGVGFLVWGIKLAFFSWETDSLGLNHHTASGADWAILGGLLAGGIVSGRMARNRLDRAVSLFNTEEPDPGGQGAAHRNLFGDVHLSPMYRPGEGVGLLVRLPAR